MPYGTRKTYRKRGPTRKTGYRTKARTSATRRYSKRKRYTSIPRGGTLWKNPIPQQGMYKFTYHDTGFAFSTNALNSYLYTRSWRGNSLFDPDYTGAGVQPYGYDNLCGSNCPFGRYTVYGSKIAIYPHIYTAEVPEDTTGSWAIKLIVVPMRTASATYVGFDDLCRVPYATKRCIENTDDAGGNNILKKYVSTRKIFPENPKLEDQNFSAAYSTDPVTPWYWNVYMDTTNYSNDVSGYFDVKIVYYARLTKTQDVDES